MPVIKKKNFLRLSLIKRSRIWDEIRDEPLLDARATITDIPGIPKAAGLIFRGSVGARGIVEFLIGDDPETEG